MNNYRIIIFAKAPLAGFAKTRLIPALGAQGAARLAEQLLRHTVEQALLSDATTIELCVAPSLQDPVWAQFETSKRLHLSAQVDGDLGARLTHACQRAFRTDDRVLLIGCDCPALDHKRLAQAAQTLVDFDAVIIPAFDGGYTLLGLTHFDPELFVDIAWSSPAVAYETLIKLSQKKRLTMQLEALPDIDEPDDLKYLPADWPEANHVSKQVNEDKHAISHPAAQ